MMVIEYKKSVILLVFAIFIGVLNVEAGNFVNNGNGTVTDLDNGLIWQQSEGGSKTWGDAVEYCERLEIGGFSDWRLPVKTELMSLFNYNKLNHAFYSKHFSKMEPSYYWTSTTTWINKKFAWLISFSNGHANTLNKTVTNSVRCVRN